MNFNKIKSHRLFKNASALAVMQLMNYVTPLLVLLHLTSVLGVELYGVVAFVTGIMLLCFVLMDFGYSLSATNKISLRRENKKFVSSLIASIFIVKAILFLVVIFLVLSYAMLTTKYEQHRLIIILSLLPIFFQGMLPVWFFQGIEKMKNIAIITISSKVLFLFLVLFFIKDEADYWYVPVFNGLGQFIAFSLSIYLVYLCGYTLKIPGKKQIFHALAINRGFFSSRVAVATYMQAGPVLLGLFSSPVAVAFYSLAEQLYKVMQSAISPIVQALYPYMSKEKNVRLYYKVAQVLVLCVLLGSLLGYMLSPWLVSLVFGSQWLPSVDILNVFLAAIVVHVLAVLMGYPICSALDKVQVANQSVLVGAFCYFAIFIVMYFLDVVSAISVAMLMIAAELCVLIYRAVLVIPSVSLMLKEGKYK